MYVWARSARHARYRLAFLQRAPERPRCSTSGARASRVPAPPSSPPPPLPPAEAAPATRGSQSETQDSRDAHTPSVLPSDEELTRQLDDIVAKLLPTAEQEAQKEWLAQNLKTLLERHTGGVLHFFGSCENGFWMNGSDVDACLVVRRCVQRQSWLTKLRLVQCLVEREKFGSAEVVSAARVPVVKVMTHSGADLCDISINNVAALENSRFVGALAQLDPRVQSLGRFIKHWASRRRINNRSEGTLSTYTLILQLFFFLQTRNPPVLPRVVDLTVSSEPLQDGIRAADLPKAVNACAPGEEMDVDSGQLRPLPFLVDATAICSTGRFQGAGRNEESLGELLRGFFQLWGQELFGGSGEGSGYTVYVYDGTREVNDLGVLVVRCPLTGKSVNPFTTEVWQAIHAEFVRAAALLGEGWPLEKLCEPAEESPTGRVARTKL